MMFALYKAKEPLNVEGYSTPRKAIMLPRCKRPPEVKEKEKMLEGTGIPILNQKQEIKLYFCSEGWG